MYGIKDSSHVQYRSYNPVIARSDEYAMHNSGSEDFTWSKILGLLKSEGTQILRYEPKTKSWSVLFDFAASGLKKITRFAIDPKNRNIVVVDNQ